MILLVGGAYQGKEGAARRMAGERVQAAYGSRDPFSAALRAIWFWSCMNISGGSAWRRQRSPQFKGERRLGGDPNRTMGLDSQEAAKRRVMEFAGRLERENPNAIVTCDEVGCGIVPMDPNGRLWRELTGAALQYLAQRAEAVYRVSCGLLQPLKGRRRRCGRFRFHPLCGRRRITGRFHMVLNGTPMGATFMGNGGSAWIFPLI